MKTIKIDAPVARPPKRSIVAPVLVALALLVAAIGLVLWSASFEHGLGRLEHEEVSAFSTIRIRRDGDERVMTFVRDNGQEAVQSRVDLTAPQVLASPYARSMFASYLYQPQPRRVLVVGLGGGAMVRFLSHHEPDLRIDVVEIDPVVVRLADHYFGVRSSGNLRVITADAVGFVESTSERYDAIFMDAFLRPSGDTDATGVPAELKTRAFLSRLKEVLAPGGVVAFNINEHARMTDDLALVEETFGRVAVYGCAPADNKVAIAVAGEVATDDALRSRVGTLDGKFNGALSFADLLGRRE